MIILQLENADNPNSRIRVGTLSLWEDGDMRRPIEDFRHGQERWNLIAVIFDITALGG
jgi:hypothetical protein